MKLSEFDDTNILTRPTGRTTLEEGMCKGTIIAAELVERQSRYSVNGIGVFLNIKVAIKDSDEETVELYYAVSYTWSKRGKMMKLLEDLKKLPEPGESLELEELVGLRVQVIIENVEKDGNTYSNIIQIKRAMKKSKKVED